ncbi:MAG: helix-turn-helix domain-containing protein [Silicimonas sp.]|nr:helix-turn-helix domain-containing protein [Silicimonas sp.]
MYALTNTPSDSTMPGWVPDEVKRYLAHVGAGQPIREIARRVGCHASTILRQVRRTEQRREDLLVDLALQRLESAGGPDFSDFEPNGGPNTMTTCDSAERPTLTDDAALERDAPRILRRLNETGAYLAIASDMEKAVVVRETSDGQTMRTAICERALAEAMALKDWVSLFSEGRIARYRITGPGRMALKRLMAAEEAMRVGLGEGADPFSEQHRDWVKRHASNDTNRKRGIRYNASESPLSALARRRDKDGNPFLSADLVAAGERLREDFELAQLGPRVTQNWDRFLTAGTRGDFNSGGDTGSGNAKDRVMHALRDLGPGLGDVVLRTCCFLEGMEAVERRMGWSARSGKIVLRIALMRLKSHYDAGSAWSPLIG